MGCEVVGISALKGDGSMEAAKKAIELAKKGRSGQPKKEFSKPVEEALERIAGLCENKVNDKRLRWYTIKVFERDEKVMEELSFTAAEKNLVEETIRKVETELDDDSESVITNERYEYIAKLMKKCVHKKKNGLTTSDKIDRIVTNRWLALPIFVAVMFIVYFVSVSWLGTIVTDWTNDTFFGEWIQPAVAGWLEAANAADWLNGLIVDGLSAAWARYWALFPRCSFCSSSSLFWRIAVTWPAWLSSWIEFSANLACPARALSPCSSAPAAAYRRYGDKNH